MFHIQQMTTEITNGIHNAHILDGEPSPNSLTFALVFLLMALAFYVS